jgi:hypothetical protein
MRIPDCEIAPVWDFYSMRGTEPPFRYEQFFEPKAREYRRGN